MSLMSVWRTAVPVKFTSFKMLNQVYKINIIMFLSVSAPVTVGNRTAAQIKSISASSSKCIFSLYFIFTLKNVFVLGSCSLNSVDIRRLCLALPSRKMLPIDDHNSKILFHQLRKAFIEFSAIIQ